MVAQSARPATIRVIAETIPVELHSERWCSWDWITRDGTWSKPPANPLTRKYLAPNDSTGWATYDEALAAYETGRFDGIGFRLPDSRQLTGIDLDSAIAADGSPMPWAAKIIDQMASYTETSPSGTGYRILVNATKPIDNCEKSMPNGGKAEIYDHDRYLTVTGAHVEGTPLTIEPRQAALDRLCDLLWPTPVATRDTISTVLKRSDDDVISQILAIPKAARLWHGDNSDYGGDASAGDLAFMNTARNLTGGDQMQMDRLYRTSGRARAKWDKVHYADGRTYGQATIDKAFTDANGATTPRLTTGMPQKAEATDTAAAQSDAASRHTDSGNAARFAEMFGDRVRWVAIEKTFYLYDDTRWKPDRTDHVRHLVSEMARQLLHEAADINDATDRATGVKRALRLEGAKGVKDLLYMVQADPRIAITPEAFDRQSYVLNVRNGTIDLRTGELRPHNPADMLTKLAPVMYDPNATFPLWDQVIATATKDEATRNYVQAVFGSALAGDPREELIAFVHGPTSTSKSTVIKAITNTMGDHAMTADFSTFLHRRDVGGARPDLVRLRGARLVVSLEVDEGRKLAEGLLKSMTGGDTITARGLYQGEIEIEPTWTLCLVANDRPNLRSDDDAIWRRLREVPFDQQIAESQRDPAVKATLTDVTVAGPAVLAWLVRGCLDWQEHGLSTPPRVRDATRDYRSEMDSLAGWLTDACVIDPTMQTTSGTLLESYRHWCKTMDTDPIPPNAFAARLTGLGCKADRSHVGRFWHGIGLLGSFQQGQLIKA